MLGIVLTLVVVISIVVVWELVWRHWPISTEIGRKFPHITVGSFAAFLPFFLTWDQIRLLSLVSVVGVLISKYGHVFKALHSVERVTYGEILGAAAVGLLTFVTQHKGVYAAAMLQMSLADGLAAVIGVELAVKKHRKRYKVFGHTKTPIGTATFFIVSLVILLGYSFSASHLGVAWVIGLAAGATLLENVSVAGFDNLAVPLLVAFVLSRIG